MHGDGASERVVNAIRRVGHVDDRALLTRFATLVLGRLQGADLVLRDGTGDLLAGALVDLFGRVDQRAPGDVLVALRPPGSVMLDGSRAEGTVVEILTDDRQFIVTSTSEELFRLGYRVVRMFHPVIGATRGPSNSLTGLLAARNAEHRESIVELELDQVVEPGRSDFVVDAVQRVLDDVVRATRDHDAIRSAMREAAEQLRREHESEAAALLDWLESDHFVPLGCCSFVLEGSANLGDAAVVRLDHGLGLLTEAGGPLRQPVPDPLDAPVVLVARTPELSRVHRRVPVHRIDVAASDGGRRRVFRVVGVFTRAADSEPPGTIPVLRRKLEAILERHDAVRGSFDEQTLTSLFDVLPRDELFCADIATLDRSINALAGDDRDRRIRVLVRPDEPSRSVSVLLALPHETYSRTLRRRIEQHLLAQLDGDEIDTELSLGNRSEAMVRFLIRVRDGAPVPPGPFDDVAHEVRLLCRTWDERLQAALDDLEPDGAGAARLAQLYASRFPASYRDAVTPEAAALDVTTLHHLEPAGEGLEVRFVVDAGGGLRCRVYSVGTAVELSRFVPIFESLGLWVVDEVPWVLQASAEGRRTDQREAPSGATLASPPVQAPATVDGAVEPHPRRDLHVHDFSLRAGDGLPPGASIDAESDGPRVAAAMLALLGGHAEVDSLNRLVITAGLRVEEVSVLRAYRRYRRQLTGRYSAAYVNDVLARHGEVARDLVRYFEARFAVPANHDKTAGLRVDLLAACDALTRLDDDRILRGMLGTIDATLRTNRHTRPDGPLALKVDCAAVPDMPSPVPYREIFVCGAAVEGVHLRFGAVARGGLRWSERVDDYRTEVLDLARTQVLKNSVIVPTGSKGGFVVRAATSVRGAYEAFVGALLDVTDNVRGDVVEPAAGRLDGDDPYLVIAADKGTAEFSDVANDIATRRRFWLGDAFASGGSRGYDHKALGVTARGAWVAVQRHFRELDVDVQHDPITVAGIGDMSGDVFGNGMLQSPAMQLVAAFDHRHIFCDPHPDVAASFAERRRLFELPGSSWADYDRSLISAGGGVWSRTDKRIELSRELREALRMSAATATPPELIQAILRAPVDLLFAGGVGTFVRAATEDDLAVDDRANSEVRVAASSLRARVVVEGANLAFTARARSEYARRGGRINLDAIDNVAGVDTSDHEVNIKILLRLAEQVGDLDISESDHVLASVTNDVVAAVLHDVGRQCESISVAQDASASLFDAHVALLDDLVHHDVVDREREALPSAEELDARRKAGAGLTRPELAMLLGGAKRQLRAAVLASDLPEDPALAPALAEYFPPPIRRRFAGLLARHRLRRELIATVVVNQVVDSCGITAVHQLAGETGADLHEVVASAWAALRVGAVALSLTAGSDDLAGVRALAELYGSFMRSYLAAGASADLAATIERDAAVAAELAVTAGQPADLVAVPSVAALAARTGRRPPEIAHAFTVVSNELGLDRLGERLRRTAVDGRWALSVRAGLLADAAAVRDAVAFDALQAAPDQAVVDAVAAWKRQHRDALADVDRVRREVEHDRSGGLDGMAVLARAWRQLLGGGSPVRRGGAPSVPS